MKKIIIALSLIIVLIAGTLFTSYTLVNDGQNLSATGFGEYVVEIVQPAQEDPTIALNEQIDALELDLFNNTQTIASLNAEVAVLLSEAEDYELQIELLNTNIATIQNQKEALEAEVATLEADALANADRIATLNAIITAKNVEIADLTSQVNALTASLADVNAQLTTANATITALTTEIADLNAYINLLEEKTTSSLSVLGQDLGTWNSVYYDTVDLGDIGLVGDITFTDNLNGEFAVEATYTYGAQEFYYNTVLPAENLAFYGTAYTTTVQMTSLFSEVFGIVGSFDRQLLIDFITNNQGMNGASYSTLIGYDLTILNGVVVSVGWTWNATFVVPEVSELLLTSGGQTVTLDQFADLMYFNSTFNYDSQASNEFYAYNRTLDVFTTAGPIQYLNETYMYQPGLNGIIDSEVAFDSWVNYFLQNMHLTMLDNTIEVTQGDVNLGTVEYGQLTIADPNYVTYLYDLLPDFSGSINMPVEFELIIDGQLYIVESYINLNFNIVEEAVSQNVNVSLNGTELLNEEQSLSFDLGATINFLEDRVYADLNYTIDGNSAAVDVFSLTSAGLVPGDLWSGFDFVYNELLMPLGSLDINVDGVIQGFPLADAFVSPFSMIEANWNQTAGVYSESGQITVNGYTVTLNLTMEIIS